jgi:hypothetical protein
VGPARDRATCCTRADGGLDHYDDLIGAPPSCSGRDGRQLYRHRNRLTPGRTHERAFFVDGEDELQRGQVESSEQVFEDHGATPGVLPVVIIL